jgi:hypothetical protein
LFGHVDTYGGVCVCVREREREREMEGGMEVGESK